jgi:chaperone required for assembly of F1-ATPase
MLNGALPLTSPSMGAMATVMSVDAFMDMFGVREAYEPRDPMKSAQSSMRNALPKRFYKNVSIRRDHGIFQLLLDGRPAKTPARKPLALSSESLARSMAKEWDMQESVIDPARMPLTRLVNVAIDHVAQAREAVVEETAKYAETDLLVYRAIDPQNLVELQAETWDSLIAKASKRYSADFRLAQGIVYVDQPLSTVKSLSEAVAMTSDPLKLSALNVITTLTGSLILGLLLRDQVITAEQVWSAAHLDEDFQIAIWGQDEEAAARRVFRRAEFDASSLVLQDHGTA